MAVSSLIRVLFPTFRPQATIENVGAPPVATPVIEDLKAYDAHVKSTLERGAERSEHDA